MHIVVRAYAYRAPDKGHPGVIIFGRRFNTLQLAQKRLNEDLQEGHLVLCQAVVRVPIADGRYRKLQSPLSIPLHKIAQQQLFIHYRCDKGSERSNALDGERVKKYKERI